MIDLLLTIATFLFALSILIAVHEYGHFWVARRSGVKVLRFSIGFGKPIWRRVSSGPDRTEYVLSAIPLGGYVKMLDEREGEVAEAELPRAFNRQPLAKRFAVVAAGPIFNLTFAVVAYWLMFIVGVPGLRPLLGDVAPGTLAAEAGLHSGQEIVEVAGHATPTWQAVMEEVMARAVVGEDIELVSEEGGLRSSHILAVAGSQEEFDPERLVDELGLSPYQPTIEPVIEQVVAESAAEAAGLQPGDRILAAAGREIRDWDELVEVVKAHPGLELRLTVERAGERLEIASRPKRVEADGKLVGQLGAVARVDEAALQHLFTEQRYGPLAALGEALSKSWTMSLTTIKMIGEMIVGRASVEHLSGPISIARYAKSSMSAGFSQFLGFLAIVSLSLGVLNLLPIPVLDGGHLMFYLIEAVSGRPVSERVEALGQQIGIILIMMMMGIAMYNDIVRLNG